jgi:hypothetical protein
MTDATDHVEQQLHQHIANIKLLLARDVTPCCDKIENFLGRISASLDTERGQENLGATVAGVTLGGLLLDVTMPIALQSTELSCTLLACVVAANAVAVIGKPVPETLSVMVKKLKQCLPSLMANQLATTQDDEALIQQVKPTVVERIAPRL